MNYKWRKVRVFISSTFRDMHSERDYLVKVVFPKLRERLEPHRVHLVDIDLRWGVTREQAENDGVLEFCLDQIDECRPFFVGILGERYGSVPETLPGATSKHGWTQIHTGKSVTELEIRWGALRRDDMRTRSLFCFRDPAFLEDVPAAMQLQMAGEGGEAFEKLTLLKDDIRSVCPPTRLIENYPCRYVGVRINWDLALSELDGKDLCFFEGLTGEELVDCERYTGLEECQRDVLHTHGTVRVDGLEEFGRQVFDGLWQAITEEMNLEEKPREADDADPLQLELEFHEQFMESRTQVYIGRHSLQSKLSLFAEGDSERPALVTGPSGSGKSAALAKFVYTYTKANPGTLVISHFVGASPGSTGLRQTLMRFCRILKGEFGFDDEVPSEINSLIGTFREFVNQVPGDRRVLLIIDSLDQLDETDGAHQLRWFTNQFPRHVKVIVSCIDDSDADHAMLHAFGNFEPHVINVPPLTDKERFEIVKEVPSVSAKSLSTDEITLLLENPATANPLFLIVALEELRGFGSFELLKRRISAFPRGRNAISELFAQVIRRLQDDFDPVTVSEILALFASARHGLSERELLDLIEDPSIAITDSMSNLFPILRQLRPYLKLRAELIDFSHRQLRKAVTELLLDKEERISAHTRLARYFGSQNYFRESRVEQQVRANRLPPTPRAVNVRKVAELPYQLIEAAKSLSESKQDLQTWDSTLDLFMDLHFLEAKAETQPASMGIYELVTNIKNALEWIPIHHPKRQILNQIHVAVGRHANFIALHPTTMFQCLWNACCWFGRTETIKQVTYTSDHLRSIRSTLDDAQQTIALLLESWRKAKEREQLGFPWLRSLRAPEYSIDYPLRGVLVGNVGSVFSVAVAPDTKVAATAGRDMTVRVWDLASGAERQCLQGHENQVLNVSFSRDGRHLVSCSGNPVGTIDGVEICVQEGRVLDKDYSIRVWNVATGDELACIRGHDGLVKAVAFSADASKVFSGSHDGSLRVWDITSGNEIARFDTQAKPVECLVVSPCGHYVAAGLHGSIRIWDVTTCEQVAQLSNEDDFNSVAFTPAGTSIVATTGAEIVVWQWRTETEPRHLSCSGIHSVTVSFDGQRIIGGTNDGSVRVWELTDLSKSTQHRAHQRAIVSIASSPNSALFVSGSIDGTAKVWDWRDESTPSTRTEHTSTVRSLAFSPNSQMLASGSEDGEIRVWQVNSGLEVACLIGHKEEVRSLAFSADSGYVISGSFDGTIRFWNAVSGEETGCIHGNGNAVFSIAIPKHGKFIVSGSIDGSVRLWKFPEGIELDRFDVSKRTELIQSVSCSSDGNRVAVGSIDGTVRVWDVRTRRQISRFQCGFGLLSVTMFPDGEGVIVEVNERASLQFWSVKRGACGAIMEDVWDPTCVAAQSPWWPVVTVLGDTWFFAARIKRETAETVAWWPAMHDIITTAPDGLTWATTRGRYLNLFRLEGSCTPTGATYDLSELISHAPVHRKHHGCFVVLLVSLVAALYLATRATAFAIFLLLPLIAFRVMRVMSAKTGLQQLKQEMTNYGCLVVPLTMLAAYTVAFNIFAQDVASLQWLSKASLAGYACALLYGLVLIRWFCEDEA